MAAKKTITSISSLLPSRPDKELVNFEMETEKHERLKKLLKSKGLTKAKFFNAIVEQYLKEQK